METYNIIALLIVFSIGIGLAVYIWKKVGNKKVVNKVIPDESEIENVLREKVNFFKQLKETEQGKFIKRVSYFLATTKISPEKGAVMEKLALAKSNTLIVTINRLLSLYVELL